MPNTPTDGRQRVVVDGSNIATEGRSIPSLAQLNEAVLAFSDEHPDALITVVVDATFGHRIDKSEVEEFDQAVAHNELVAPPAGAIGRGDAFVLGIAAKVGATILSNDSFQEFHGEYPWLFDEGRLVGGKPVPNIGWVFVNRVPVKGPVSRRARSTATATRRQASKLASQPMPVPTKPPPGPTRSSKKAAPAAATSPPSPAVTETPAAATQGRVRAAAVNDLLPFLDFVERHPVGTTVTGVVESYSSHGAYVTIGDLRGYVPLRLMASPPPRSARDVLRLGETAVLVVESFAPARRSVDLAVPAPSSAADGRGAASPESPSAPPTKKAPAKKAPAKKAPADKAPAQQAPAETAPAAMVVAGAASAKSAAKKAPAARAAAKAVPAKKAPAEKAPAEKASAKRAPAEKASAKKAPAKKAAATKAPGGPAAEVAAS